MELQSPGAPTPAPTPALCVLNLTISESDGCLRADVRSCSEFAAAAVVEAGDPACVGVCNDFFILEWAMRWLYRYNLADMIVELVSFAAFLVMMMIRKSKRQRMAALRLL